MIWLTAEDSSVRAKAALKRPHYKRCATDERLANRAKRLECARLTAAFGRTMHVE